MMRARRTLTVSLVALLAGVSGAQAAPPPESGEASPGLSPLARAVTRTPVPLDADGCGVLLSLDGERTCTQAPASPASPGETGSLEELLVHETARGWPRIRPLNGPTPGAMVRVHSMGEIAAMGADGETLWRRSPLSYYADWELDQLTVPVLPMGVSPFVPQIRTSERTFAVHDLTGDGVDDVAFGAVIRETRPNGAYIVSMVTLLDGADGAVLWHRKLPGYVTQVLVAGDLLVVGNETGDEVAPTSSFSVGIGEDGTRTGLAAYRVDRSGDAVTVSEAWNLDTGKQWARALALEPMGPDRVALAWSDLPLGSAGGTVVGVRTDGTVLWEIETDGYPRALRSDPGRDRLVVHVQHEPGTAARDVGYTLLGLDASDGSQTPLVVREDALLLGFLVEDATGDGAADLVTSDLQLVAPPAGQQTAYDRVIVASGDSGVSVWEETTFGHALGEETYRLPGNYRFTFGLAVAGGKVLAAADEPFSRTGVRAFDGATGALAWQRIGGHEPFPLFLDRVGDGVAAATEGLLLRILDPADGSAALRVPILADVYRTATADLTGDGTDDLVAAVSSGVFAFDGAALPGELRPLWKTPTQGTPRDVEIADISGDGKPEIVVPATLGVDVLRADGSIRDSIPVRSDLPDPFVWTVTVADVDGDEDLDLVVPTTSVAAFDGASGDPLWEFAPRDDQPRHFSEAAVASDGTVVLSMVPHNPRGPLAARHSRSVVALDGASGVIAWLSAAPHVYAVPILWRGVELWEEDGSERVATLWNGRPDGPPVGSNVGRVDVYDVSTGELLSRAETSQMGSAHIGLERAAGQLLEYRLDGQVNYIDADTAVETGVEPSVDGALAHLGPGDERLALSYDGVTLYGKGAHSDPGGGDAEPVATWDRFMTGDLTAVDLDADGTDELVAGSFDWQAFSIVASYYGTQVSQVSGSSVGPRGLVILDPAA